MIPKPEKKHKMIWTGGIAKEFKMLMISINLWMRTKDSTKPVYVGIDKQY
jgi:hypothetical protein